MDTRDDPGNKWTGVEETTTGSESRFGKRAGGVVGPTEG